MRLQIMQAGEEVLRSKARQLSRQEIFSDKIQEWMVHMRETMRHAPDVGLPAPQVRVVLQLPVIEDREEHHKNKKLTPAQLRERERKPVPYHVVINPRIVSTEHTSLEFFEGCLSVAGYSAMVPRALGVECRVPE